MPCKSSSARHIFLPLPSRRMEFLFAVKRSNLVVIECSLDSNTIESIIEICSSEGVPVWMHIVSEIKAERYWKAISNLNLRGKPPRLFGISGKPKEIGRLLQKSGLSDEEVAQFVANSVSLTKALPLAPDTVCDRLCAKNVLITPERPNDGRVRWALLSNGTHYKNQFEVGSQDVKNYLGLSESTCAAFINSSIKSRKVGRGKNAAGPVELIGTTEEAYVRAVQDAAHWALLSAGATPDSVIIEKDISLAAFAYRTRWLLIWRRVQSAITIWNTLNAILASLGLWSVVADS